MDDVGRALTRPRDRLLPQQVGIDELQRTSQSSSLANASGRIFSLSGSTRVAIRHEETMLSCRFPPPLFSMTVGADCVRRRGGERSFSSEVAVTPVVVAALLPIRRHWGSLISRSRTIGRRGKEELPVSGVNVDGGAGGGVRLLLQWRRMGPPPWRVDEFSARGGAVCGIVVMVPGAAKNMKNDST